VQSRIRGEVLLRGEVLPGRKHERSEASIACGLRGRLRGRSLTQRSKDAKRTGMGEMLLPDLGVV